MRIEAQKPLWRWVAEAWDMRGTFWLMLLQHFRSRYAGTWIGAAWMLAFPSFYLLLLVYFSSNNGSAAGLAQHSGIVALILGVIPWNFVVQSVNGTVNNGLASLGLMQRTFVPEVFLVLVPIVASLCEMFFLLILATLIATAALGATIDPQQLHIFIFSLPALLLGTLGISQLALVAILRWRDTRHLLQLLVPASVLVSTVMVPCGSGILAHSDPTLSIIHGTRIMFGTDTCPEHYSMIVNMAFQSGLFMIGTLVLWRFGRRALEA
jgi:ABC-type polysaccharide/polyol phosphate export permease